MKSNSRTQLAILLLGVLLGAVPTNVAAAVDVDFSEAWTALKQLAGTWQSRGYGLIAEIGVDKVSFIEQTPIACVPSESYSAQRFLRRLRGEAVSRAASLMTSSSRVV